VNEARHKKWSAILAASLLLPPAGLVLLWLRSGTAVLKKIAGSLLIAAIGFAQLVFIYGMKIEFFGGMKPAVSFKSPERQYRAVEESRAAQVTQAPAPAPAAPGSTYWADFRGPNRLGHYDQQPILTAWPEKGLRRLWKQPSGGGYASFSVAHGLAFTIEQRRDREVVAAYDVHTGRERWSNSWKARFEETLGGDGPRATPVWDEGRLYALGAAGELRCLDASNGKVVWNRNILSENGAANLQWGMAASPLVLDGKVIVLPGGPNGHAVVAYDKLSGKFLWGSLDDQAAYASPVAGTVAGRRQLLLVMAGRAVGVAPEDGKLLWEYPWVTQQGINAVEPIVVGPNRVYLSSGYGHGAAVLELTPEGQVRVVWTNNRMKNKFNGPVLHEGHIYGLDEGILACIDVETGNLKWKGGRYGYGQILLASGHLVVLTEEGDLVLVRAAPDSHHEVARFGALKGKTWNYPAICDGLLLVRNEAEMAAFQIGTGGT
jgi:outer membrane protein assembly factor BamB